MQVKNRWIVVVAAAVVHVAQVSPCLADAGVTDAGTVDAGGGEGGVDASLRICKQDEIDELAKLRTEVYESGATSLASAYSKYLSEYRKRERLCNLTASEIETVDYVLTAIIHRANRLVDELTRRLQATADEAGVTGAVAEAKNVADLANTSFGILARTIDCFKTKEEITKDEPHNAVCTFRWDYRELLGVARRRQSGTKSLCGGYDVITGDFRKWCVAYGLAGAVLSQIWRVSGKPEGLSGARFLSVAVPYVGLRFTLWEKYNWLAFDANLFSAYFLATKDSPALKPCRSNANALEVKLPCEANPGIQPYGAVQAGVTLGRNNVGFVTISPFVFGWAAFGSQGIRPFFGMMVSSVSITATF